MQQRTAIARAFIHDPKLILMDEPFGALDALTRIRMHALVRRLSQVHRPAVLLVTHDVEEALLLADRALVLRDGVIDEEFVVDVPRPRALDNPRILALRRALLRALGVDADLPTDSEETR
jgi:sulfonate transport system ATP-binding protein